MTIIAELPTAGLFEDMEREDDELGPMPDESFYRLMLRLTAEDDLNRELDGYYAQEELDELLGGQWVAAGCTGPVTAESRPCAGCGGSGGHVETTYDDDGTQRSSWRPCGSCGGSGRG